MSAPLVREMATPLRRSAKSLNIYTQQPGGTKDNILFLNQKMATEIEIDNVDESITTILVDIIQYNKETGWGKARIIDTPAPVSFNVPSDVKERIQAQLLRSMNHDKVYIQTYYVRNSAEDVVRLIIVGIIPTPER